MELVNGRKTLEQSEIFTNGLDLVVGKNIEMNNIMSIIHKVKDLDTTVLLTGETGTGKSLLAKYLHNLGYTRCEPFIHINCASSLCVYSNSGCNKM